MPPPPVPVNAPAPPPLPAPPRGILVPEASALADCLRVSPVLQYPWENAALTRLTVCSGQDGPSLSILLRQAETVCGPLPWNMMVVNPVVAPLVASKDMHRILQGA